MWQQIIDMESIGVKVPILNDSKYIIKTNNININLLLNNVNL